MAANLWDSLGTTGDDVMTLVDGTRKINLVADDTLQIELDDMVLAKLNDIKTNYESIFSWNINQVTERNNNVWSLIDRIREELEPLLSSNKHNGFNELRFYLQLIITFELYTSEHYKESLKEIKSVIEYMESCEYDESIISYSDAYIHIAQSTYAYIALTLNIDCKMVVNIKPANILNQKQRAAICGLKAKVFSKYTEKGKGIALKFAEEARNLDSSSAEHVAIWLKTKGRVRRYYHNYVIPDTDELNAAELLCSHETSPSLLALASKVYCEAGFLFKIHKNLELSKKYYKLSSDLMLKVIDLAKDDSGQLSSCLLGYVKYPIEYRSTSVVDNLVKKLSNANNNSRLDHALGEYYFRFKKDYKKAKEYLSRAVAAGHFDSSLLLIKVECTLQTVDEFPLVKTLTEMYEVYTCPKRKLLILSQILLYLYYYEKINTKEILHYLKLFMDIDIDDTFKKQRLIFAYPLFKVNGFKTKQFLNALSRKLNTIKRSGLPEWNSTQKKDFDSIFDRFDKMSNGSAQSFERPISLKKGKQDIGTPSANEKSSQYKKAHRSTKYFKNAKSSDK